MFRIFTFIYVLPANCGMTRATGIPVAAAAAAATAHTGFGPVICVTPAAAAAAAACAYGRVMALDTVTCWGTMEVAPANSCCPSTTPRKIPTAVP